MSILTQVALPARVVDRHVGGNTTYARYIAAGLEQRGLIVSRIPSGRFAPLTALYETKEALRNAESGRVLHYTADTGPLLKTRQPSVVTVHGVASRWMSTARNPRQELVWRTRVKRAIASTDAVITVSDSSADDIAHIFDIDPSRITTIHHGIDRERFEEKRDLPHKLAYLSRSPYVLYLGNIEPRKNLIELVRAFDAPDVKATGARLVIAGNPAWNAGPSLSEIAASRAIYLGFVTDDERTALMQNAALFVFPTLYEGFGFPVLEAMAAGTPVLTSTRGSLRELAGPALTLSDVSRDSIADGIVAAFTDSAGLENSRSAGLEWVKKFSWEESVAKHIDVYHKVLAR